MKRKAIFFDADGTVTDMRTGVPESAKMAIQACRENGHLVFLCTGRCRAMIDEGLMEIGFDGIIGSAGAYLEKDGEVLYNKEVTLEEAKRSVEILRNNGMVPILEGKDHMYYDLDEYTDEIEWTASWITKLIKEKHRPITGNEDRLYINKISAKTPAGSTPEAAVRELGDIYDAVIHNGGEFAGTIELLPKGHTKALGVEVFCRLLGIEKEDTICFGDSNNDIDMFKVVHTKVAMGNASEKILEMSDLITSDMYHYGIRDGLRALKLI